MIRRWTERENSGHWHGGESARGRPEVPPPEAEPLPCWRRCQCPPQYLLLPKTPRWPLTDLHVHNASILKRCRRRRRRRIAPAAPPSRSHLSAQGWPRLGTLRPSHRLLSLHRCRPPGKEVSSRHLCGVIRRRKRGCFGNWFEFLSFICIIYMSVCCLYESNSSGLWERGFPVVGSMGRPRRINAPTIIP